MTGGDANDTGDDSLDGGDGNDSVSGGLGDDTLVGGDANDLGNDTLDGGDGDDSVSGGGGNDTITAGTGDDTVDAGSGDDTVDGGTGNDAVTAGEGNDSVDAGAGDDTVEAGSGDDTVATGSGDDSVDAGEGDDSVDGGEGHDTATGGAGDDTLTGGDANDTGDDSLDGGDGNDSVSGGLGDDTLVGGDANDLGNDTLDGGDGNDMVSGGGGNDTITAGTGDDTVDAGAGDDTVDGGTGNDAVTAGEGNDSVDAGAGDDTVEAGSGDDTVTTGSGDDSVDAGEGDDSVDGGEGHDTATGGGGDDTLTGGDANDTGDDSLDGGDGNDSVSGGLGDDTLVGGDANDLGDDTLDGGDGNDRVSGGGGNDTITAGTGDDTVDAGSGDDTVSAGDGNDSITAGAGNDSVNGGQGHDTATGGAGDDTLIGGDANDTGDDSLDGGVGNDSLNGGQGNDTLIGGDANDTGADTLIAGDGNDSASGGGGNDSIDAGTGDDTVEAGTGDDTVSAGAGHDSVDAGAGDDSVSAGDGDDSVTAGDGNDTVTGGNGHDSVDAGTGDDSVDAGTGDDTVSGGAGNDVLQGRSGNDSLSGGTGNDSLDGGEGADTLDGGAGSDTLVAGGDNDVLVFDAADALVDGGAGNDRLIVNDSVADFTALAAGTVVGIEQIDMSGNGTSNTVKLAETDVIDLVGATGTLIVHGDSGDNLRLTDFWTLDPNANQTVGGVIYLGYTFNGKTLLVSPNVLVAVELTGSAGDDTLSGGAGTDSIDGAAGNDSLTGGAGGADTLRGGDGNDTADGGSGDDLVDGGAGDDSLQGGTGDDTLSGGTGSDTLDGGAGADSVSAGDGDDVLVYDAADVLVDGGAGNDRLIVTDATLDLTQIADTRVVNLEQIDLRAASGATGANLVKLAEADVRALAGPNGTLWVHGDAGDSLALADLWTQGSTVVNGGVTYQTYTRNGLTLNVAQAVTTYLDVVGSANNDTLSGGAGNDNVDGAAGNDYLQGNAGDDTVSGGQGSDTLYGGTGHDTLVGGDGNDTGNDYADGGDGNDSLSGGAGHDTLLGANGNDTVLGEAGHDSLDGGSGDDSLDGGADNDTLQGAAGADTLRGGAGNDSLVGGDHSDNSADSLDGGDGSDTLYGGAGNDTVQGGAGNDNVQGDDVNGWSSTSDDTLDGGDGDDTVNGGMGNDSVAGGAGHDSVLGGNGNDTLDGGAGNDTVYGEAGDDTLGGGEGADTVDGGAGNDTLSGGAGNDSVSGGTDNDVVDGGAGDDTVLGGTGHDTLTGGDANDTGHDSLDGGDGNDSVSGGLGNDTLLGNTGDDTLAGGDGADSLDGGTGNDSLDGGAGNDTALGGAGNDTLSGGDANDTGHDSLDGGDGNDSVSGGLGNDTLLGGNHDDTLQGGDGNDSLDGGTGNDSLDGGAGNDTVQGGAGNDTAVGGTGDDSVVGGDGNDTGNDSVDGGDGHDTVDGGAGHDTVLGGAGHDTLLGGAGNDSLDGGTGNDSLNGGDGNDTLVFDAADSIAAGGAGTDTLQIRSGTVDFSTLVNPVVSDVEIIDLTGNSAAALTLDYTSVRNLSSTTDTLYVLGDYNDTVTLVGGWTRGSDVFETPNTYQVFTMTSGGVTVTVKLQNTMGIQLLVTGTSSDDALNGTAQGDLIRGLAGHDTLSGGDGNDQLRGGAGNDVLDGGNQIDTVDYSEDTGGVTASLATGTATDGGGSTDTLSNVENLTGSGYDDSLTGDGSFNLLDGGAGHDTLDGGDGADTLLGGAGHDSLLAGAGNDVLTGGGGNDTLQGGAGNDTADYSAETSAVTVNLATGTATDGSGGTDTLSGLESVKGGAGDDLITGDSAANRLEGSAGADTLAGGAGSDTLDGGAGNDVADYSANSSSQGVNVNLGTGTASDGQGGTDTLSNFEGVTGGAGNDSVTGSSGNDTLVGNAGTDSLDGGAGHDSLSGGSGADTLRGGAGNDTLAGGDGTDLADFADQSSGMAISLVTGTMSIGGTVNDTLTGIENVRGGTGADTLTGDTGANELWGGASTDSVSGGAGNDSLRGGTGNDTLDGGDGTDTLLLDDITGPVVVNLGSTAVTVSGTAVAAGTSRGMGSSDAGTDTLSNFENIVGSGGADTLIGSAGDNVIEGAMGADSILAGAGNDTVYFDDSDAAADGGDGTDTLVVGSSVSTLDLTLTRDEVYTNFEILDVTASGSQLVKLSDADVRALTGGGTSGTLVIQGGADDIVRLVGANWPTTPTSTETLGGVTYDVYAYSVAGGTTTVKVQQGVSVGYLFRSGEDGELTNGSTGGDQYEGNGGNDTFNAGGGDDYGDSGEGDDIASGDAGHDTLLGGAGQDTLDGGTGNDSLEGGTGDDSLTGGTGHDTLDGGAGHDSLNAGDGYDSVLAGDGQDTVSLGAGDDTANGGAGNDLIDAGSGDDEVAAGIGDDTVIGGAGNDVLDGNSGVDTLDYSADTSDLTVNLITGTASSTDSGTDQLSNFENITAGSGNDSLTGSDAANRLIGGAGNDTLLGGNGDDWLLFDGADASVDGGAGADVLAIQTTALVDFTGIADNRFTGIEALDLTGSGNQNLKLDLADVMALSDTSDVLKVHGDAGDQITLVGNWTTAGTQPVSYEGGATQQYVKLTLADPATGNTVTVLVDPAMSLSILVSGTSGDDTLNGGGGNDTVQGGGGNDTLTGGAGNDTVQGEAGDDYITYDAGDASIDGGTGNDTLGFASDASGLILDLTTTTQAISGIEVIDITGKTTAPAGHNTLVVDLATVLALSTESDTLTVAGTSGDTVYLVGTWSGPTSSGGYNVYTATDGTDTATIRIPTAVSVGTVIDGTNNVDTLAGTGAADLIRGLDDADSIDGGAGNDILRGGAGNDTLVFDANDPVIDGGTGTDTLEVSSGNLDLTALTNGVITSIEVIDLKQGAPASTLTLNAADVAALNGDASVTVEGDASDAVALQGNWTQGATAGGYTTYTLEGSTVVVDADIPVSITFTGSSVRDVMLSGAGRQLQDGSTGSDSLDGGEGADTLRAGTGDDTLVYDADDLEISGGTGTDTLKINGSGVTVDLTQVANSLITGIEKIDLTGTGDNVVVVNADDVQAISSETDTLIVTGDAGDSVRLAGSGWEARGSELVAGITYNKYVGTASDGTQVTLLAGLKIVKGDQLIGTAGDDTLTGSAGSDQLLGGDGNDVVNGAGGSDLIDAGNGDDTVRFDLADSGVDGGAGNDLLEVVADGQLIDLQEPARPATGALRPDLSGFEVVDLNTTGQNLVVLDEASLRELAGANADTTLEIRGDANDIVFVDGTLTSTLTLTGGVVQKAVTAGTAGDDTLTGTSGQDAIKAGAGHDSIHGGAGADLIYGGAGNDTITYDAADLRVFGGTGTDELQITTVDADGGASNTSAGTNTATGDVDLTTVAGTVVDGIEVLNLRGNGNQTVLLDEPAVLALSDTGRMVVKGDAGDVLKLYGGWTADGLESDADGKIYNIFKKGDATVSVQETVTLQITNELGAQVKMGTTGNDDTTVPTNGGAITNDGDDILRVGNMAFTGVDGGRGYDKVYFQLSGYNNQITRINTLLLSPTALTNIEEIDLTRDNTSLSSSNDTALSYVSNKLILTPDKLLEMTDGDGILVVKGDITRGAWYDPLTGSYPTELVNGSSQYITRDSIDLLGDWGDLSGNVSTVVYNGVTYTQIEAPNGAKLLYTPGMTVAPVNPTPQLSAFSIAYDDGAYLVGSGIDQYAGWRVANAGDVNKDGIDDIIVNAAGKAYVVFGTESMAGQFDLANLGSRGFTVSGLGQPNLTTSTGNWNYGVGLVNIGDVNGDGIDDLLGVTDTNNARVVYGRTDWTNVDLTNTSTFVTGAANGYSINSLGLNDIFTMTTTALGDVNGDGFADFALAGGNAGSYGKVYVMFGGTHSGDVNAGTMGTNKGFWIGGDSANIQYLGTDISAAGDVNGDGFDDILIGAPGFNNVGANGQADYAGNGYIVFGKAEGWGNTVAVIRDATAPWITGSAPSDNATNQSTVGAIYANFNESLKAGIGLVNLYNSATGQLVESFNMATGLGTMGGKIAITGSGTGTQLVVNPYNPLAANASFYLTVDAGAVTDLAGNAFAGISNSTTWNFSTGAATGDVTAPTLSSTFSLTYSSYYYDNYSDGRTVSYTTNGTATGVAPTPGMVGSTIWGGYADWYYYTFSFSEALKPYGTLTVKKGSVTVETINLATGVGSLGSSIGFTGSPAGADSSSIRLNLGYTLQGSTGYTFEFSGLQDGAGNALSGSSSIGFTTAADTRGPLLVQTSGNSTATRGTPFVGQTGVSVQDNLVFTATEALKLGASGLIEIRNGTNATTYAGTAVASFNVANATLSDGVYTVTSSNGWTLTLNGKVVTIDPAGTMAYNTTYALYTAAGALTDQSGNDAVVGNYDYWYGNVNGTRPDTYNEYYFTTANGLITYAGGNAVDHSLKVGVAENITISFGENVGVASGIAAGAKFIKLYNSSGTLIESFDAVTGVGSKGGSLVYSGKNVVINPAGDLAQASGYYLTVDANVIASTATPATKYAGATNSTTLYFSTEAGAQIDPGQRTTAEWAGQQVEAIGDFDGDGTTDYVIGTYQHVADAAVSGGTAYGKFYVVFGKAGTLNPITTIDQLKAEGRVVELYGTSANQLTRIVEFGDVNHDGFDDLLLTAGGRNPNQNNNGEASDDGDTDAGAAFIVFGQERGNWASKVSVTNLGDQGLEITGGLPEESFGFSVAAGDFNNDGTVDMVFGMPNNHRDGYASGEAFVINGGDYTDSLMQVGTSQADVVVGDYNANRLAGQQGNDTLYGLGGEDILRGGSGDDVLSVSDLDFLLVDGGTGTDTLQFKGHNIHLDMTGYAGASLRSFEKIDITGDGANSLIFNYREAIYLVERQLAQAYGQYYQITVDGNADDKLTLEGPWARVVSDATYTTYALDGIYVKVDSDIQTTVAGWTVPYLGATVDLMGTNFPSTLRKDSITGFSGVEGNWGSYLVNLGDVNQDGFADFGLRNQDVTTTQLHYTSRWIDYPDYWDPNYYWLSSASSTGVVNGAVTVLYGKAGGVGAVDVSNLGSGLTAKGITLTGSASANEQFGSGFGSVGDINGDGFADMLVAAPTSSRTFTFDEGGAVPGSSSSTAGSDWSSDGWSTSNEGRTYIFLGGNSNLVNRSGGNATTTALTDNFLSDGASTGLPGSASAVPNNGSASNVANTTYTYTTTATKADGTFIGSSGAQFGANWRPVMVGDVNGDGFDDFLSGNTNAALVFGKATGWTGLDQTQGWTMSTVGSWSGVASAGDVNGDGYADFLVNNGNVSIVFGKAGTWNASLSLGSTTAGTTGAPAVTRITAENGQPINTNSDVNSLNAATMRSLGDINGDGYGDILIAANHGNDYNAKDNGGAYVVFGAASGWGADLSLANLAANGRGFRITGSVDYNYAGYNITAAGDMNGDGLKDFLITEYNDAEAGNGTNTSSNGSAYLILGRQTGWKDISLLEVQDYGIQLLDGGWSSYGWNSLGDIDGDGFDDLSYGNTTTATILYGSEAWSTTSNVGVQHVSTTTGATLTALLGASVSPNPNAGMDRLIGNAGNDTLVGDGGRDVLIGGAGSDRMVVADANFFRLDGGTGVDTVELTGNMTLNFTGIANNAVANIEVLKLGTGDQALTLSGVDVLSMTGEANTGIGNANYQKGNVLVIDSTAGTDSVTLTGGWNTTAVATGVTVDGTGSFSVYQYGSSNVFVLIDSAVVPTVG
ncbi:Ig-like domain-containing protein [Ideonella livida]|uniref:Ig-like domain-containing protein n=1 Tax=Ideonella livida TaxID=2707176 RepID=UPI002873021A|nr:Ig-like domain-containing protein [Ideonella livida]